MSAAQAVTGDWKSGGEQNKRLQTVEQRVGIDGSGWGGTDQQCGSEGGYITPFTYGPDPASRTASKGRCNRFRGDLSPLRPLSSPPFPFRPGLKCWWSQKCCGGGREGLIYQPSGTALFIPLPSLSLLPCPLPLPSLPLVSQLDTPWLSQVIKPQSIGCMTGYQSPTTWGPPPPPPTPPPPGRHTDRLAGYSTPTAGQTKPVS